MPGRAPRGELIDVGGRRLHVVRAGPRGARSTIVLEHGAFGCGSDWGVVQAKLAAKGLHSIAYDRAGIGHSDPGPAPRDAAAINADLSALLAALGEAGPFVLVGHSMGGLMVRRFALAHPVSVLGVVLVDAMTPEVIGRLGGAQAVEAFSRLLSIAAVGARFGLMHPVSMISGNLIGLEGSAAIEKRRIHASASHARGAALEVASWPASSHQAGVSAFPPGLPIAVVNAGDARTRPWLKRMQALAADASRAGYVEDVKGSSHASLLGRHFGDPVVRGIEHVLAAV